jgi:hypothetical protein
MLEFWKKKSSSLVQYMRHTFICLSVCLSLLVRFHFADALRILVEQERKIEREFSFQRIQKNIDYGDAHDRKRVTHSFKIPLMKSTLI